MLRVTLKGVRGHLLRFLLTAAAVTLGVSLVSGTFVLTDSIDRTFDQLIETSASGTDVSVRGAEGDGSTVDGTAIRTALPITLEKKLAGVDGVARAVPDYQGQALLVGKDGTAVRSGGAPSLGFAYSPEDPALQLVAGRGPRSAKEVAVETRTLELSGLKLGDSTRALIGSAPREVTIVGQVKFDAPLAGATVVVLDRKTAAAAFAPNDQVQSFSLTAAEGVSQAELRDRVKAVLPAGPEALTGRDLAAAARD